MGRIGNDRAGGGTDQSTCNYRTSRSAREASDQCARTTTDQRATEYAVVARRLASAKRQHHHGKQYNLAHSIPPSRFDRKNFRGCASNLRRHINSQRMSWERFRRYQNLHFVPTSGYCF
jgi:hypothetical protein